MEASSPVVSWWDCEWRRLGMMLHSWQQHVWVLCTKSTTVPVVSSSVQWDSAWFVWLTWDQVLQSVISKLARLMCRLQIWSKWSSEMVRSIIQLMVTWLSCSASLVIMFKPFKFLWVLVYSMHCLWPGCWIPGHFLLIVIPLLDCQKYIPLSSLLSPLAIWIIIGECQVMC